MASYRDRLEPELLRFPGLARTRILIGAGLFFAAIAALLVWQFGGSRENDRLLELVALALLAVWLLACWPREIVCGPASVEQFRIFGMGKLRVPWDQILAIEEKREFGGAGALLRLQTRVIAVIGRQATIRHTPRHPDPERFLRECRMRMEEWRMRHSPAPKPPAAASGERKR